MFNVFNPFLVTIILHMAECFKRIRDHELRKAFMVSREFVNLAITILIQLKCFLWQQFIDTKLQRHLGWSGITGI